MISVQRWWSWLLGSCGRELVAGGDIDAKMYRDECSCEACRYWRKHEPFEGNAMKQDNPWLGISDERLRMALGFTRPQWQSLKQAAEDSSMELRPYIRQMLLVCAGHGGIIEHSLCAGEASVDARGGL